MYVWSKRAFGPFAAFMTGWTYWSTNLPYFPGLLYFAAANALFVGGPSTQALSTSRRISCPSRSRAWRLPSCSTSSG